MRIVTEETWEVHEILTDLRLPYAIIGGRLFKFGGAPIFERP